MLFNGRNLFTEYGLRVNQRASFLPPLRRRQIEVESRHGVVNLGSETFGVRTLVAECMFVDAENAQGKLRKLAGLLSQRGRISFLDEPELYYVGRVYDGAELTRIDYKGRKFDLAFECEPFIRGAVRTISMNSPVVPIEYAATAPAPCRITIRNIGTTPVNVILVTHVINQEA